MHKVQKVYQTIWTSRMGRHAARQMRRTFDGHQAHEADPQLKDESWDRSVTHL